MNILTAKGIEPMLIAENRAPFDSPDYLYELKLDGSRCLAYLTKNSVDLRNRRNKSLTAQFPELGDIYKQVQEQCILDGELIVSKNGKPDFYALQRRCLLSDSIKIKLAVQNSPASLVVFDILYLKEKELMPLPLMERKKLLAKTVQDTPSLAISRYVETKGIALYQAVSKQKLEGIVAKQKQSKYYPGKRTREWIKIKDVLDEDFVVCGYYQKTEGFISVILGKYQNNRLLYQGHVVIGLRHQDYQKMAETKQMDSAFYQHFPSFVGVTWLKPTLVCRVQYIERTPGGGLRQPVFRGLRHDKNPRECMLEEIT